MKGYKGFDKDLKCRGFQYETGKEFEHKGEVKTCNSGFHFCENPMDVLGYYPPSDSRYCEVEGDGEVSSDQMDSKVAVSKIKIGVEIGLKGLIEAGLKFILEKVEWKDENNVSGDQAGAQATGYKAGAQATGDQAGAQATGDQAGAQATGDQAGAQATGDQAGAQATGYQAGAQATGYQAGAQATGDMCMASTNGYESSSETEGDESIACGLGYKNKAKGALGNWLVIAERGEWNGKIYPIKAVKCVKVDGEKIKTHTWYTLKNGDFVEDKETD